MQKKKTPKDVFFVADEELIDAINQTPRPEEVKQLTIQPNPSSAKLVFRAGVAVAQELEKDERSRKSRQPRFVVRMRISS